MQALTAPRIGPTSQRTWERWEPAQSRRAHSKRAGDPDQTLNAEEASECIG
jgi:hypothetical protein